MTEPRQHHILPAFYLAGFTRMGSREDTLHVFDYLRGKRYNSKPGQVARERDYYRTYEPDTDPFIVEKDLEHLETELAPILHRVRDRRTIRGPEELAGLLSLVALIHARGQLGRERLSGSLQATMSRKLEEGEVTREQWEQVVAAEIRAGVDPSVLPSFDQIPSLIQSGSWRPKAPEVLKVGLIPEAQRIVLEAIVDHTWSLAVADPTTGGFICSDTPLTWASSWAPDSEPITLNDPNAVIMFPLSKDLSLITRDDGRRGTYEAAAKVVASVNSRTLFMSQGMVYSASENFLLLKEDNQIDHSTDYFWYVQQAREAGIEKP